MKSRLAVWSLVLTAALPAQADLRDGPRLSPFRGMRAVAGGLEVQVEGDTWYALESVGGVDTAELLCASRQLAGAAWWKRITEDLPALLAALGHEPGARVDLRLRDLATGEVAERPGVPMTAANRQRLLQQNRLAAGFPVPEVEPPPARLAGDDARADLQALRTLLDTQFAYRTLRPVDLDALLRQAEAAIGVDGIDAKAFARVVDRVVRAFGDGHSRVDGVEPESPTSLPFLVQQVAGGVAAFHADRRGFVDAERPFLVALDGVPVDRWLAAAAARATAGSPAMQARAAERGLRQLGALRLDLGLPAAATVRVRLRGPGGEREHAFEVADRPPAYGIWPLGATRRLDGDLGYLRLEQMRSDPEFLDAIDAAMHSFRGTKGLVVDVRGNGGGTRDALRSNGYGDGVAVAVFPSVHAVAGPERGA